MKQILYISVMLINFPDSRENETVGVFSLTKVKCLSKLLTNNLISPNVFHLLCRRHLVLIKVSSQSKDWGSHEAKNPRTNSREATTVQSGHTSSSNLWPFNLALFSVGKVTGGNWSAFKKEGLGRHSMTNNLVMKNCQ